MWEAIEGTVTINDLVTATGLERANLRRILRDLRDRKVIAVQGGQGKRTTYRRALEQASRHSSVQGSAHAAVAVTEATAHGAQLLRGHRPPTEEPDR